MSSGSLGANTLGVTPPQNLLPQGGASPLGVAQPIRPGFSPLQLGGGLGSKPLPPQPQPPQPAPPGLAGSGTNGTVQTDENGNLIRVLEGGGGFNPLPQTASPIATQAQFGGLAGGAPQSFQRPGLLNVDDQVFNRGGFR